MYDINSNLSYTNLRTVQVFDPSGSSTPPDFGSTSVINVDILNVTSSITWQNPCGSGSAALPFNYFLVWNDSTKQVCVMTSSAIVSGSIISGSGGGNITSIIGGPGVTIISGSGPIVTISASAGGTGSGFPFTGSGYVTGSLIVTGSISSYNITSSLYGTASWAISASQAITASYTVSSSYSNTSSYSISSSYSLSSSFATSASYANNGIPTGGTINYILAKSSSNNYDTVWIPSPAGPAGQGEFSFTSSYFSGSTSSITCSSEYSFWHLHTLNNLNIHISSSVDSGSFSIRLVSSGSNNNTINF